MNKKIAVFGIGISGLSTANYYANKGRKILCDDDNKDSLKKLNHPNISATNFSEWNWSDIEFLVLAPGITLNFPDPHNVVKAARAHNVKIICDIECLFLEKAKNIKLVGITGTNGKSTTTALINHIFNFCGKNAEIGGNFGIPAMNLNMSEGDVKIIEISSFQLELLDRTFFDYSLLLNITPDHLYRHGGMENYIKAKERIFENQNKDGFSIVCTDQEDTKSVFKNLNNDAQKIAYITGELEELKNITFDNLPGHHNLQNITGAYLVGRAADLEHKMIIDAIKCFKGLEHRIEKVCEKNNFVAINDSKATNADATEPALKTFDNIIWLAGGVPKEGGITSLQYLFPKVKQAFFYGDAKNEFADFFKKTGNNFEINRNLSEAIKNAQEYCSKNPEEKFVILLSPACASFDEFKNFEERGKFFKSKFLEG